MRLLSAGSIDVWSVALCCALYVFSFDSSEFVSSMNASNALAKVAQTLTVFKYWSFNSSRSILVLGGFIEAAISRSYTLILPSCRLPLFHYS